MFEGLINADHRNNNNNDGSCRKVLCYGLGVPMSYSMVATALGGAVLHQAGWYVLSTTELAMIGALGGGISVVVTSVAVLSVFAQSNGRCGNLDVNCNIPHPLWTVPAMCTLTGMARICRCCLFRI